MALSRLPTRGRVLEFWHTRVRRSPWRFRDKFGIVYEFRPGDSFAEHYDRAAALDDAAQLAYLERTIVPGMTVVDIGANIGGAALLAARLLHDQGRLYAFEADPDTYAALCKNFELNGFPPHFEAINCAVTAAPGNVTLYRFPRSAASWNSLARYEAHGMAPEHSVEVRATTLDEFARERELVNIDLLKVDVEGAEPEVFAGAVDLLRELAVRRVMFEVSHVPLAGSGHRVEEVIQPLLTAGYVLHAIEPDGRLVRVAAEQVVATTFGNFVALA